MDHIIPIPSIGDSRYSSFYGKPVLDILRVMHYQLFGKDLSISGIWNDDDMFDPNIWEYAQKYLLRGRIPSTIMLASREIPTPKNFLNWKLDAKVFDNPDFTIYLNMMREFMQQTIGSNFNFVYTYGNLAEYYMAYIPTGENKYERFTLLDFFQRLMDNNAINVVWLGNDLLNDSPNQSKILDLIAHDHRYIQDENGIDCEERNKQVLTNKLMIFK